MPTVEDTRIDEIGDIILDHRYEKDPRDMNALKYSSYLIAKKILEYMAPIIEKAEKLDKLTAITADKDCKGCPVTELCGEQFRYCVVEYILLSAEKTLEGDKKVINHKLLCLLEGKCWHEWEWKPKDGDIHIYECAKCGLRVGGMPQRNDYSSPNTYMPFLQWFWKERKEMWDAFLSVHPFAWDGKAIPYLFSLTTKGKPRIMVLLSEWLALPETREKWGESKCNSCNGVGTWPGSGFERKPCPVCNGTGRIKAQWAIEVKDAD